MQSLAVGHRRKRENSLLLTLFPIGKKTEPEHCRTTAGSGYQVKHCLSVPPTSSTVGPLSSNWGVTPLQIPLARTEEDVGWILALCNCPGKDLSVSWWPGSWLPSCPAGSCSVRLRAAQWGNTTCWTGWRLPAAAVQWSRCPNFLQQNDNNMKTKSFLINLPFLRMLTVEISMKYGTQTTSKNVTKSTSVIPEVVQ